MADGWRMTGVLAAATPLVLAACVATPGCSKPSAPAGYEVVEIGGRTFTLEVVADKESRTLGLGGRDSIPEDGGMLFSFPDARILHFVMRDCVVPIDVIFLDAGGRIVAMHHMPVEPPIQPDETRSYINAAGREVAGTYERRLKRYSSRYNAQYAIELRGGMLESLNLQPGQQIDLNTERLGEVTE